MYALESVGRFTVPSHSDALTKKILFSMWWTTHGTTDEGVLSAKTSVRCVQCCSWRVSGGLLKCMWDIIWAHIIDRWQARAIRVRLHPLERPRESSTVKNGAESEYIIFKQRP